MSEPISLVYSFGNHMHWVDMEWLWGYDVLPSSTEDMLKYCRDLGVKGNINFDGIGYEKMAAESPESLAMLRQAIREGIVEVVGASYGQPYGLFQGGESNVRQRIYGVRTAMRTLGIRPKTFWEEEFDFYPQLPQMLAGCGFTGASLYFQWTWHTPEIPFEDEPVVAWEGIDGTQIPTATRNRMNLHQWPEDFRILLDDLAANPPSDSDIPRLVLQWLELMPTQDWMCRSELMAPMLRELQQDPRFEIIAMTLGEYLEQWKGKNLPVRHYKLDDVWHGMTLGKNGDRHPKRSLELEDRILAAETAQAILGLFGRPYDPWDVYPTWEIEEAWRNLLAAQHHDNHECEGLCGHVAQAQFAQVESLTSFQNSVERLARRVGVREGEYFTFNRYGWPRFDEGWVPAMGYSTELKKSASEWVRLGDEITFQQDDFKVVFNVGTLTFREITSRDATTRDVELRLSYRQNGEERILTAEGAQIDAEGYFTITFGPQQFVQIWLRPEPETGSVYLYLSIVASGKDERPDPGYRGSVRLGIFPKNDSSIAADSPYAVQSVGTGSTGKRKYPEGDWMTSPQWFELVEGAFTSQSFVDFRVENGTSLLVSHSSAQQWFLADGGAENVVLSMDPWDESRQQADAYVGYRFHPHQGISNAECIRRSAAMLPFAMHHGTDDEFPGSDPVLPRSFSAVTVHQENVLATAFYREQASHAGRDLPNYAATGISHPYILRLVEYNGESGEVEVTLPGPIAKAFKTNLLGELIEELHVGDGDLHHLTRETDRLQLFGIKAAKIKLTMRAYEIATIYLDIVPGRKQYRDLDAKREIWATVHRVEEE